MDLDDYDYMDYYYDDWDGYDDDIDLYQELLNLWSEELQDGMDLDEYDDWYYNYYVPGWKRSGRM